MLVPAIPRVWPPYFSPPTIKETPLRGPACREACHEALMAAPSCFPVSQGAIVGGLNSWRLKRRAAGNAPTPAWSIPRCAEPPTSSTKTSNVRAARPKTAIGEHAILLSKTMAAIVFDNARRQGIIKRGLRPPSEESEGLAFEAREAPGSSELRKKPAHRRCEEYLAPLELGRATCRGPFSVSCGRQADCVRSYGGALIAADISGGRQARGLRGRRTWCRHRPPPHRT
jgi:hypothetical protein